MAAGHTDGRLRRSHIALFRGVHVERRAPLTLAVRIEAALLVVTPGSHVSHYTAATLWGGVVPAHPDIHVSSPRNRTRRDGITAHRFKEGQEVVRFSGFRVTSPVQTFLDLAHCLTLVDLVE